MPSRSLRSKYTPEHHRCCGALISIGAYGDWHLCEACEMLPSERHLRRRARITGFAETERETAKRADRSRVRR